MSFWKKLFGGGSKSTPIAPVTPRRSSPPPETALNPSTPPAIKPSQSPPKVPREPVNRDKILEQLEKYWATSGGDAKIIERILLESGAPSLKALKEVARDSSVKLHLRKAAIACAVAFDDPNTAAFLAEFVNGKNPGALYAAYDNGDSKAGAEFGLFRTAKEYLEKTGHTFTATAVGSKSTQPFASSSSPPPLRQPMSATPPQPATPRAQSVAELDREAFFLQAVGHGDLEKVKALLMGNPELVFSRVYKVWTHLHVAACNGHKDIVELLLANNADVNAKDKIFVSDMPRVFPSTAGDSTPLHFAAFFGHIDVSKILLANQAEVNAKNSDGKTPLGQALLFPRRDVAELLRQHGGHE